APKKNVGGNGVPKRISFNGGTMAPPPNCVTCVNVGVSPPWVTIRSELAASIVTWPGEEGPAPPKPWPARRPTKPPHAAPPAPDARRRVSRHGQVERHRVTIVLHLDCGRIGQSRQRHDQRQGRYGEDRVELSHCTPLSAPVRDGSVR